MTTSLLLGSEWDAPEPDHFGSRFSDYATKRSAVSARQATILGLTLVAAIVRRRLVYLLAHGPIYTSLWSLLLAPSGEGHKSTLLRLGGEVLDAVDARVLLPHEFSLPALIAELASKKRKDQQGGSMGLFVKDEAAGFLAGLEKLDYQTGGKDALLDLNGSPNYRLKKLRQETFELERVYLNVAMAGVPSRLAGTLKPTDWYSGFMARFAVVLPEAPIPWRDVGFAIPDHDADRNQLIDELCKLTERLGSTTTEVGLTPRGLKRYNQYGRDLNEAMKEAPEDLRASYERFPELALRIAALIAVTTAGSSTEGGLTVPMEALVAGIRHAEVARQNAHRLFEIYSGVADEADIAKLVGLVKRSPGVTRRRLQQNAHMLARTFNAAFDAAVSDGRICFGPDKVLYAPG